MDNSYINRQNAMPSSRFLCTPYLAQSPIKRGFDVVVSSLLIVVSFPLLLISALVLKSQGQVFDRLSVVGQGGRSVELISFSTSSQGWLSRWLKRSSFDQLPNLFNVLWGDLSLVGPRPLQVSDLNAAPHVSMGYLKVRPGLTGLWLLSDPSAQEFRKSKLDRLYMATGSFLVHARILMRSSLRLLGRA